MYGIYYTPRAGTYNLIIKNTTLGTDGNVLGIDDIELRFCVPKIITPDTVEYCVGTSQTIPGTYTDDGTLAAIATSVKAV